MSKVLDRLQRELVTEGRVRPVVDVLSSALSSGSPQHTPGPAQDDGAPVDWTSPTPQLVRSRKEQRRRRFTRGDDYHRDLAGAACKCGTEPGQLCGLHARLGHRRHVRPG
jgi:hypothetical protein